MKKHVHIIGACSCWGAQVCACEKGPETLAKGRVFDRLKQLGIDLDVEMLHPKMHKVAEKAPIVQAIQVIEDFNRQITNATRKAVKKGSFPVVIGGDHSIAVGTWNGFDTPFGLIWIDAHMDAHTPETTPSGACHGMPVAALMGYGAPEMARAVLKPQNLALIGIRSFEKGEETLLKKLNVRIYYMEEVQERGLKAIIPEAIAHVTRGVSHFGVSLDLDAFTPADAPGVDTPVEGGIPKEQLLPLLSQFSRDPRLIGFEMVEFNPDRDQNNKTRELSFEILKEFLL